MTAVRSLEGCPRSWEIDAVRDGRLRGNDAASLERHLKTCDACAAEHTHLARLTRELRELPAPQLDAIASRRIRGRVLMDHNRWLLRQEGSARPRLRRSALLLVACSALLGVSLVVLRVANRPDARELAAPGPTIDVLTESNARWHREASAHEARVVLEDGELRLRIQRQRASDRVTIVLPDGTLEDRGTVLDVRVSGGRTEEVTVEEGSVMLRLRGELPRALAARESWHRAPAPVVASPPASSSPSHELPVTPSHGRGARRVHVQALRTESAQRSSAEQGGAIKGPARDLPTAAEADAERAEDEAYLRLVDLVRRGRASEARAAAKDYLLRFPNGFRRLEVLNIATQSAQ